MTHDLARDLKVTADGTPVESFNRACLRGSDALGLYPMPFTLKAWNLSDSDYYLLLSSGRISVSSGESILVSGAVSDVYRRTAPEGKVTEVLFSPALPLWEAPVSPPAARPFSAGRRSAYPRRCRLPEPGDT